MNKIYREALDFMEKSSLSYTDFKWVIEVSHGDGSRFMLHNAMVSKVIFGKLEMLLVWTEHCGYHAFFVDDLEFWRKYKIV